MTTEIYIESQQADLIADLSSLLTFAIDDVADFSERQTTWSKTIILPGTKRNNQILGNVFEIGREAEYNPALPNFGYNFNASKSASCIIFQDNIQAFQGVLRLLQININKHQVEYEVAVFGTMFSLNVALSGALLEDLDFSAYNHEYNEDNIVDSWDNESGTGYFYPLIDYGTYSDDKHNWDIRTFRPAFYVAEFIDKIFTDANFRYSAPLFETERFQKLIIPNNQKFLVSSDPILMDVSNPSPTTYSSTLNNDPLIYQTRDLGTNFTTSDGGYTYKYVGLTPLTVELTWVIAGNYVGTKNYSLQTRVDPIDTVVLLYQLSAAVLPYDFSTTVKATRTLQPNDTVRTFGNGGFANSYTINITSAQFIITPAVGTSAPLNPGDEVDMNVCIPRNIRQIDFLVSLVKLFNLYVYEDRFDSNLIYLKPYIDFYDYDSSNSVDWTYKLNRDKARKITPMSELNSKIYKFNYKDDSDYYNDLYKKRYGTGYGSYIFDSQYEFASETNSLELIFAPTPLVGYAGEDKVYSTICKINNPDSPGDRTEESVNSVIRILQSKKITGVANWSIKDGATILVSGTTYGYAGHFDNPTDPENDLNFGATRELFYELEEGALSVNQFNVYWSPYMAEITDKDSKLLIADFYLKPKDIYDLDFSKFIVVDGVLFRLNKISDYDVNEPKDCTVELLKVINTTYS